jgi:GAF domain-containing protein
MTDDLAVHRLVDLFDELGPEISAAGNPDAALEAITTRSLKLVPGAEAAGVTRAKDAGFETVGATSDLGRRVDAIQYELGTGPCVAAALTASVFRADDLSTDERWPEFGRRAADETGVRSMLSFRMFFEDDEFIAALNLYATQPRAFDSEAELIGLALVTYGALALTSARRLERIVNLERALASNRDIGVAIGILMALHRVTREQAFDLLRMASQGRHRKLVEVARDVAETGTLEVV